MRHSVSIIRGALFIALFGSQVACPPSRVNPVTNRVQQRRYERLALGFLTAPPGVVFLELRDGADPLIRLHQSDQLAESDLMEVDAALRALVDDENTARGTIIEAIRASGMGSRLEARGIQWAKPQAPPLATELGKIVRQGPRIVASADAATEVTVATLGDSVLPESDLWLAAPDGSMLAVELTYGGTPRVRDLRLFSRARIDADLAQLRADQAMERNADSEAAADLDFAAARVPAGDPLVGALAFARARLAARRGDVPACVAALRDATARDARFRGQAVRHPDFETVRKDPRFVDFLALAPP
jgi:hypothetical protein